MKRYLGLVLVMSCLAGCATTQTASAPAAKNASAKVADPNAEGSAEATKPQTDYSAWTRPWVNNNVGTLNSDSDKPIYPR